MKLFLMSIGTHPAVWEASNIKIKLYFLDIFPIKEISKIFPITFEAWAQIIAFVFSLILFSILADSSIKLSDLSNIMIKYPQVLINTKVSNDKKNDFYMNTIIKNSIIEVEELLGNKGRVLVRPSGTEPLIRVMLEGEDTNKIEEYAKEIANIIEKELS